MRVKTLKELSLAMGLPISNLVDIMSMIEKGGCTKDTIFIAC
jgi:hypothetical protein